MCKDTAPTPGPEDHYPDHVNRRCLHCGDLTDDPTRCPGWLGHRTLVRFHAEAWEHDDWTGIVATNDSMGYVVTQRAHKDRLYPGRPSRLMAAVTTYHRIAEPADHEETLRQLLDGANDAAAMLNRSFAQERDRALRAEARVRELEEQVQQLLPTEPDGDYIDHESYHVVGRWGVDGNTTRPKAVRHARQALIEYPGCEARVDREVSRTWDDGSQFISASETIDLDGEPE